MRHSLGDRTSRASVVALLFAAAVLSGCAANYAGDAPRQVNTNPGTAGQDNARDAAGNPVVVGEDGRPMYGDAQGGDGGQGGANF